jgi:hypothetical protein
MISITVNKKKLVVIFSNGSEFWLLIKEKRRNVAKL